MRNLTSNEVNELFAFTRNHYVEYYDLQLELVDHLACGIEAQWVENESISFDDALQNEFKKFGIFGFSDIVDKRRLELNKKYNRFIFRSIINHLKKKEYLAILLLISIFYLICSFVNPKLTLIVFLISFYSFVAIQYYRLLKMYKNKLKENNKKFILTDAIFKNFSLISIFSILFNLSVQSLLHLDFNLIYVNIFFALILPILFLALYITCYFLPSKYEEILEEMYPEYKLIKE